MLPGNAPAATVRQSAPAPPPSPPAARESAAAARQATPASPKSPPAVRESAVAVHQSVAVRQSTATVRQSSAAARQAAPAPPKSPPVARQSAVAARQAVAARESAAAARQPAVAVHQPAPDPPASQEAPALPRLRVSLLTILPGSEIYSLWGHSALRITDEERGLDITYNYGTFDFEAGHFVLKFLHGNLDYTLSAYGFEASFRAYQSQGRPIIEQTLNLAPEQQQRLLDLLAVNLRPENRRYRYHFLFDNCSTRIRDILEAALGEEILRTPGTPGKAQPYAQPPMQPSSMQPSSMHPPMHTFRALIDPYQRAVPFLDAGIDILLGAPVDRPADWRARMFLPEYLMEAFGEANIRTEEATRPLVARTDTLLWVAGYGAQGRHFPWETMVAWAFFAVALTWTLRRPGLVRTLDAPLFLAIGLTGLLIAYLWFVSHHDVTNANRHLFWAWPVHALAAVLLLVRRTPSRLLAIYMAAASAATGISILISPFVAQPFPAAFLPVALLAAVRAGAIAWPVLAPRPRHSPPDGAA